MSAGSYGVLKNVDRTFLEYKKLCMSEATSVILEEKNFECENPKIDSSWYAAGATSLKERYL